MVNGDLLEAQKYEDQKGQLQERLWRTGWDGGKAEEALKAETFRATRSKQLASWPLRISVYT